MFTRRLFAAYFLVVAAAWAQIGSGSSREDVLAQWGPPKARAAAGSREILTYAEGRVVLENGAVVQLDFKGALPATVPAGLPAVPEATFASAAKSATPSDAPRSTVSVVPGPVVAADVWLTNFEAAKAQAKAQNKQILALFTGSDWCPPCMEFEAKVATSREFLAHVTPKLVLLKLDYPRRTRQPEALLAQNQKLQQQFDITAYPTFKILDANGGEKTTLRTTGTREATSVQQYFIQAVDEGLGGGGISNSPLKDWRIVAGGALLVLFALGKYWGRNAG